MDINGARKAGYKDEEIAKYLSSKYDFNVNGALKSGYSLDEINSFLVKEDAVLSSISRAEGTDDIAAKSKGYNSGYDVTLGYGAHAEDKAKPITSMTLAEVYSHMGSMKADPSNRYSTGKGTKRPSSAVGKYQFVEPTLRSLAAELGYDDNTVFTPEVQDRMASRLIRKVGYKDFADGKIDSSAFQDSLATQWASVPSTSTGVSLFGQSSDSDFSIDMPQEQPKAQQQVARNKAGQALKSGFATPVSEPVSEEKPLSLVEAAIGGGQQIVLRRLKGMKSEKFMSPLKALGDMINETFTKVTGLSTDTKESEIYKKIEELGTKYVQPVINSAVDAIVEGSKDFVIKDFDKRIAEKTGIDYIQEIKDGNLQKVAEAMLFTGAENSVRLVEGLSVVGASLVNPWLILPATSALMAENISEFRSIFGKELVEKSESLGIKLSEEKANDLSNEYAIMAAAAATADNIVDAAILTPAGALGKVATSAVNKVAKKAIISEAGKVALAASFGTRLFASSVSEGIDELTEEAPRAFFAGRAAEKIGMSDSEKMEFVKRFEEDTDNANAFVAGALSALIPGAPSAAIGAHTESRAMSRKIAEESDMAKTANDIIDKLENPTMSDIVKVSEKEDGTLDVAVENGMEQTAVSILRQRAENAETEAEADYYSRQADVIAEIMGEPETTVPEITGVEKELIDKDVVEILTPQEDASTQIQYILEHQNEMSERLGREVTVEEASLDWVAIKPEIKESLAELYRERFITSKPVEEQKVPVIEEKKVEDTNGTTDSAIVDSTASESDLTDNGDGTFTIPDSALGILVNDTDTVEDWFGGNTVSVDEVDEYKGYVVGQKIKTAADEVVTSPTSAHWNNIKSKINTDITVDQAISDFNVDEKMTPLFDTLKSVIGNIPVLITEGPAGYAGKANIDFNTGNIRNIEMSLAGLENKKATGSIAMKTLAHEMIHAAIHTDVNTDKYRVLANRLGEIRDRSFTFAEQNGIAIPPKVDKALRGKNAEEVATWAYTNEEAYDFFNQIPSDLKGTAKKETMWDRIILTIAKHFKKAFNTKSALADVVDALSVYAETSQKPSRKVSVVTRKTGQKEKASPTPPTKERDINNNINNINNNIINNNTNSGTPTKTKSEKKRLTETQALADIKTQTQAQKDALAAEGAKEADERKRAEVRETIKKFTDKMAVLISNTNELAAIARSGDNSADNRARAKELVKSLPKHLIERAREGKTIDLAKAKGREAFKNKSPEEIREWLSDKMGMNKDLVDEIDDESIVDLKDTLAPYWGVEGLQLREKILRPVKAKDKKEIEGTKDVKRGREAELYENLLSGTVAYLPSKNGFKGVSEDVVDVFNEMLRGGMLTLDEEGNVFVNPDSIVKVEGLLEKAQQVGSTKSLNEGRAAPQRILEEGVTAGVTTRKGLVQRATYKDLGRGKVVRQVRQPDGSIKKIIEEDSYNPYASLEEEVIESRNEFVPEGGYDITGKNMTEVSSEFVNKHVNKAVKYVLSRLSTIQHYNHAVNVIKKIDAKIKRGDKITLRDAFNVMVAMDSMKVFTLDRDSYLAHSRAVYDFDMAVSGIINKDVEVNTVKGKLKDDRDTGVITQQEFNRAMTILYRMNINPNVMFQGGSRSFYDLANGILQVSDVRYLAHEASHWAYYNLLTPAERKAFRDSLARQFARSGRFDTAKMESELTGVEYVLNRLDNPSEYFANLMDLRSREGSFKSEAEKTWQTKIADFFRKLLKDLFAIEFTRPMVREYANMIWERGEKAKHNSMDIDAADMLLEDNQYGLPLFESLYEETVEDGTRSLSDKADKIYLQKPNVVKKRVKQAHKKFKKRVKVSVKPGQENKLMTDTALKMNSVFDGVILSRDIQMALDGKLDVKSAQAAFLSYAAKLIKTEYIRKPMFNSIIKIKKVGDANWNNAVRVFANAIEKGKHNDAVRDAQKILIRLNKRDLSDKAKLELLEATKDVQIIGVSNENLLKINDEIDALVSETMEFEKNYGFESSVLAKKIQDLKDRVSKNPLVKLSTDQLIEFTAKLNKVLELDREIKKAMAEGKRAVIAEQREIIAESVAQYDAGAIASKIGNMKEGIVKNALVEVRKNWQGLWLMDLNLEYMAKSMGEAGRMIRDLVVTPLVNAARQMKQYKYDSTDKFVELVKQAGINTLDWSIIQFESVPVKALKEGKIKSVEYDLVSGQKLRLSYDELANLLRVFRDEDGYASLIKGGLKRKQNRSTLAHYRLTPQDILNISSNVPDEVVRYAFVVGDEWFNKFEKDRLNKIGQEYLGRDIANGENTYTPLLKDGIGSFVSTEEYASTSDILNRMMHSTTRHGSLKERSNDKSAIVIEGMGEAVTRVSHEHSVFAGYGKIFPQVETATKMISDALIERGGESIADKLSKKIASMVNANDAKRNNFVQEKAQALRSVYAVGKLGWKVATALIQSYSGLLYAATVPNSRIRHAVMPKIIPASIAAVQKLAMNEGSVNRGFADMIDKSITMRDRFHAGFSVDLTENSTASDYKRVIRDITGYSPNYIERLLSIFSPRSALAWIRTFDAIAMYQGWEMAKERVRLENPELSGDAYWDKVVDTHDEFVRLTQSTSDEMDNTAEQDAPILSGLVMFSSAISKQWQMIRKVMWDLSDAVATKDKEKALFAVESAIAIVLMQGLTEGTKLILKNIREDEEDEPEEIARKTATATTLGLMQNRILFGNIIASLSLPAVRGVFGIDQKIYQNDMYITSMFDDVLDLKKQMDSGDTEKTERAVLRLMSSLGISAEGMIQTTDILKGLANDVIELE